jgi:hypothetical protein
MPSASEFGAGSGRDICCFSTSGKACVRTAELKKILALRKFSLDLAVRSMRSGTEYGGENASVIYYRDSGTWHELRGSD